MSDQPTDESPLPPETAEPSELFESFEVLVPPEPAPAAEAPTEPATTSLAPELPAAVPPPPPPAPQVASPAARRSPLPARLISALWLGSGAFILLAAPAVFSAAGSPGEAANAVGAMLSRWHYLSLLAPAILLTLEWRNARTRIVAVLFATILFAAAQVFADIRIRQIRNDSIVAISSLEPTDPVRRRFGVLHGISSLLLIAQTVAAAAFLVLDRDR